MKLLPEPVRNVSVPNRFRASVAGFVDKCLLRVLLEHASSSPPRLASGHSAALGLILHRLIEDSGKGKIERSGELEDDLLRHLESVANEIAAKAGSLDEVSRLDVLKACISPLEWERTLRRNIDIATRVYRPKKDDIAESTDSPNAPEPRGLQYENLSERGRWHEVEIECATYRLKGRIDCVEKNGDGIVRLIDYKTGRILDEDGAVLHHIQFQLSLYALMVADIDRTISIQLVAEGRGGQHSVPCSTEQLEQVRSTLENLIGKLSAGTIMDVESVSNVGSHCRWCPFRHVCISYKRNAPRLWIDGVQQPGLSLDVWGTVKGIDEKESGEFNILVQDASGRTVKIFGLGKIDYMAHHFPIGKYVWFFGLHGRPSKSTFGTWLAPRNFHVSSRDATDSSRLLAEVFERPGTDCMFDVASQ